MKQRGNGMPGPLTRLLLDDHRRLDALLQSAVADPLKVDLPAYNQFRAGLLRHIGMEEKILSRHSNACRTVGRFLTRPSFGSIMALLPPY